MKDKRYICIKSFMYDPKIVTTIASVGRSQMSRCLDVMRLSVPCHGNLHWPSISYISCSQETMSQRSLYAKRIYQEPDRTLYITVQNINTGGTTSVLGTRVFPLKSFLDDRKK